MWRSPRISDASTSHGQLSFGGRFDLSAIFAELRRNPGQTQLRVDLLFGFRGNPLIRIETKQAVFVERQPHLQSALAKRDIVILAAGEILHRRAVTFGRKRPHIHLNAFEPDFRAGLVLSTAEHFVHARKAGETLQSRSGIVGR